VAGFGVPSDIVARYHRLRGDHLLMVSGTDEHGTPVMVAADREGLSPRETADRYSKLIRENLRDLGLSYDLFTRTTTANHYRVAGPLRTLYEATSSSETWGIPATTGHTLPDGTSRALARSAVFRTRAEISATTAGTSSTRPI
jgi:methionyl-tRNA synthetase